MSMVGFPLLLIPLAIYNIIVFLMPGVSFADPLVKLTLMSGAEWPLTLGDILLALGILLLLLEIIKGARPGSKYLTDHLLSLIVFGGAAAEFLLWPRFGTSTLFPAGNARAGGFPVGHCVARAAWSAGDVRLRGCEARGQPASRCRAATSSVRSPRRRQLCRQRRRSRNPCCWITPNRRSRIPRSHQMRRHRRSRRRNCSPAKVRRRRRMRRRTDLRSSGFR